MSMPRGRGGKDRGKKRWGGGKKRRTNQILNSIQGDLDFKDAGLMRQFISPDRGKIMPRRRTAATAKKQRKLAKAIRRARQVGVIPYTLDA